MTTPMAATASTTALTSCRSMASANQEPMPGSFTVVSPTVMASEATTKNQPPDIDIMVFQIKPGAANGTSSRQKRSQPDWRKWRPPPPKLGRDRAQRLIEAEAHVPSLAGEDREDRRALSPQLAAGKQPHEEGDREGEEAEHRHRLQNVEGRNDDQLRLAALGRHGRDHEGEQQRGEDSREHPQGGA